MRLPWFGPTYCGTCGDPYITATYRDGFDRRTGKARVRTWQKCRRLEEYRPVPDYRGDHFRDCLPPPPRCVFRP